MLLRRVRPVNERPDHQVSAGTTVLLSGLIGVGVGVAGLAAKALGVIPRVRIATLTWGAVVTVVGLALISHGSMRLPDFNDMLRGVPSRLVQLAVAGVAWSAAFVVEVRTDWAWKDAVATAAAALVVAPVLRSVRRVDARTTLSVILAAMLVTFGMSAMFKREQYPFAPFQMYSVPQLDPREVTRHRLIATAAGGAEIDITSVLGTATVAKLVSDPDESAVADAVSLAAKAHEERRGSDLVSVRLVTETWRVVPYPGEATVERAAVEERMVVDA